MSFLFPQPHIPRVPTVVSPPPPTARPRPPARESMDVQQGEAQERQLFRQRGRRRTLITAGQGAGAPATTTRELLGQTGR